LSKLFRISASPRRDSASSAGGDAFLARFRETHAGWDFDTLDLWRESLPEFDGAALEAKYARTAGRPFNDPQRDAFAAIERMVIRLALGDRVLISTPMWNFGIPYKLKQYFDLIVQPGLAFTFDPSRGY
jgi:FMN-dependent NADH-azoreductase